MYRKQLQQESSRYTIQVGYCLYNKTFCRLCMTNIARHIVKVGFVKLRGTNTLRQDWYHFDCVKDIPEDVKEMSVYEIDGFLSLKHVDQQMFMQRFEELKLVESRKKTKKRKRIVQEQAHTINLDLEPYQKKIRLDETETHEQYDKYGSIFHDFRSTIKNMGLNESQQVAPSSKPHERKEIVSIELNPKLHERKQTASIEFNPKLHERKQTASIEFNAKLHQRKETLSIEFNPEPHERKETDSIEFNNN